MCYEQVKSASQLQKRSQMHDIVVIRKRISVQVHRCKHLFLSGREEGQKNKAWKAWSSVVLSLMRANHLKIFFCNGSPPVLKPFFFFRCIRMSGSRPYLKKHFDNRLSFACVSWKTCVLRKNTKLQDRHCYEGRYSCL